MLESEAPRSLGDYDLRLHQSVGASMHRGAFEDGSNDDGSAMKDHLGRVTAEVAVVCQNA